MTRIKIPSPKSANQRGASKTSLSARLANNLSISAPAAHSPLFSFCLPFCLFVSCPILLLHPSAPGWPQRGVSRPFHGEAPRGDSGVVYMGGAGPMKGDLHLFKQPYFGYLKEEGGC